MAATTRVVNLSSSPRNGSYSLKETVRSFLKCLGFGPAAKPEDPPAVPSSTSDPFAAPLSTTTEDPAAAPPSTLAEDVALGQARPPPKGGSGPHNNTDHT
ncbi:hypothetical protein LOK49_LG05G02877 [Camellia lanceoleosa]|uniref:Uncharacterized protein n=1 Tax=Camellia lanceoleosa TaxID=1840588 RepID=A0ACC0HKM5_9ERIC|nr:hypothetical protein LOK49_LG05G02877 [Camellia lanceoleosa]